MGVQEVESWDFRGSGGAGERHIPKGARLPVAMPSCACLLKVFLQWALLSTKLCMLGCHD
jgi:hypothetical protein